MELIKNIYFKMAMAVGAKLKTHNLNKKWEASKECATLTKMITLATLYKINEININELIERYKQIIDEKICDRGCESIYTKGFITGEIFGLPTEENLLKVEKAEKIWITNGTYGYYQDVCEDIKNERI